VQTHRRNSSPDNGGHRRGFLAVVVLLGNAFARLFMKESTNTFGKRRPCSCEHRSRPGLGSGAREQSIRGNDIAVVESPGESSRFRGRRSGQLFDDVWRSSSLLLGDPRVETYTKAMVSTWEPGKPGRVSELNLIQPTVIARITRRRTTSTSESSPMRRSGGGASVVVRDGNAVHMAKGGRMFRFEQRTCSAIERLFNEHR